MLFLGINHVALHVSDVERSVEYYGKKLGFDQILRPNFDFEGAWFELGGGRQLHLIGGRTVTVHSSNRGNHFAIEVSSISETADFLRSRIVKFMGPKQRPDGAWQIFLIDPDGHFVEFCELLK
jgi:catechol 2,3-dioxygenase-like lactoylglutathione lyase family enzyme